MRKITGLQILIFSIMYFGSLACSIGITHFLLSYISLSSFYALTFVFVTFVLFFVILIIIFRIFLTLFPLKTGNIDHGSRQEFIYHIYILFYLMGFYTLLRSQILPVPFYRSFYIGLGLKAGINVYPAGMIQDAQFVEIGDNSIIGQNALIVPHAMENDQLSHDYIKVGKNTTIGAGAIVFQGVTIGDNAIVAAGSVVTKGTSIGDNEIWGGLPAKFIKKHGELV